MENTLVFNPGNIAPSVHTICSEVSPIPKNACIKPYITTINKDKLIQLKNTFNCPIFFKSILCTTK